MVLQKRRSLLRRSFFLGVIFCYSVTLTMGQIAGGLTETTNTRLGGNNYIVGTIFTPDGVPINRRMSIRLTSPTWGDILATTDDRGRFVFSGVGSGVYTVVIDREDEFEPVNHQVEIVRVRSTVPETYTVTIRLRLKEAAKSSTGKPGVVSATNAGVPKKALDLYQSASKLAGEKDYKGAIQQLKLAIEEYPKYLNALNQIGVLYLRINEPDKADDALKAALKINPEAYEPLLNRSVALFRLSKFKDAEKTLRETLKVKPESSPAYYYLGRTLIKLSKNDEAEKAFLTCLKMSPGEFKETHRFLAAIYLDRGASDRVVEELETYLKLVPTASDADHLRQVIKQLKSSTRQP